MDDLIPKMINAVINLSSATRVLFVSVDENTAEGVALAVEAEANVDVAEVNFEPQPPPELPRTRIFLPAPDKRPPKASSQKS